MKKTVNFCGNCPFLYSHYDDFAVGDSTVDICNLARFIKLKNEYISSYDGFESSEKTETPEWCPLKKEEYSFKFKVFSDERLKEIESTRIKIEEMEKLYDMREDEVDYDDPKVIEETEMITDLYTKLGGLYESEELLYEEVLKKEIADGIGKIEEQLLLLNEVSNKLKDTFNDIDK